MKRGRKSPKQAVVDYPTTGNGASLAYFREPKGLYLGPTGTFHTVSERDFSETHGMKRAEVYNSLGSLSCIVLRARLSVP